MVQGEDSDLDEQFVDNTLGLEDIPQIELPFRDDLSNNLKNLIRALVINQQNIISNCSFLYKRVQELSNILQRIAPDLPAVPPQNDPIPPRRAPKPLFCPRRVNGAILPLDPISDAPQI